MKVPRQDQRGNLCATKSTRYRVTCSEFFFGCTGACFLQLWVVALSDLSFSPSPPLLISVSANVSLFFISFFGLFALLESLLVVRELGVQVTTKYVDGREKSTVRQTFDPPIKKRTWYCLSRDFFFAQLKLRTAGEDDACASAFIASLPEQRRTL